jgi:hypothetical protein
MSNHCSNALIVTGRTAAVRQFVSAVRTTDAPFSLESIDPPPVEGADEENDRLSEWCVQHWGTRDFFEWTVEAAIAPGMARYQFETSWQPALEWVRRASLKFPTLCFSLHYVESGWSAVGSLVCVDGVDLVAFEMGDARLALAYNMAHFGWDQASAELVNAEYDDVE